ncbi:hypothetical protein R6Q57_002496 [Mikania cordata]
MGRSGIVLAIILIGNLLILTSGCLYPEISRMIEENKSKVITGIHLGTSSTCVGVYMNGQIEIIPNDQGNHSEWFIGEDAKNQKDVNAKRTIFDVMRFVGRRFEDKEVQSNVLKTAYFNDAQREPTRYACLMAGWDAVTLIIEPTAHLMSLSWQLTMV